MINENPKRLTEVYEILKYLNSKDFAKIPKDIIDLIEKNKDNTYKWELDKTKKIYEQELNDDTVAILSYINMEYLVDTEKKNYLKKLYDYYETKKIEKKNKKIT